MKIYAVIDTNVLVSALLKSDSVPGNVMDLALGGPVIPVVNEAIIKEYRDVLYRTKFHFPETECGIFLNSIIERAVFVDAQPLNLNLPDPKDCVFYEVVMEKRNDDDAYLVTGNLKHFPAQPFVVTPREFLDLCANDVRNSLQQ